MIDFDHRGSAFAKASDVLIKALHPDIIFTGAALCRCHTSACASHI
jgi:hypothetical protein